MWDKAGIAYLRCMVLLVGLLSVADAFGSDPPSPTDLAWAGRDRFAVATEPQEPAAAPSGAHDPRDPQDEAAPAAGASSTGGPCDPCDVNCDSIHDFLDVPPFVEALVQEASGCSSCGGDLDDNGLLDGRDIQPFVDCLLSPPPPMGACCTGTDACVVSLQSSYAGLWMGPDSTCQPNPCAFGNLTAYRPQHGAGYFPFAKTAVAEADEESAASGGAWRRRSSKRPVRPAIDGCAWTPCRRCRRPCRSTNPWVSRTGSRMSSIPFPARGSWR